MKTSVRDDPDTLHIKQWKIKSRLVCAAAVGTVSMCLEKRKNNCSLSIPLRTSASQV